jgi:hypothetical protein
MRRRWGVGVLLVAAVLLVGPAAGAETPGKQGWWTATGALGLPAGVAGPDVPDNGLLVEGGPSGPRSYAAVSASLPVDSALLLDVAANSITTADVPLQLCPLTSPSFTPEQGGSLDDAPEYDCDRGTELSPSAGRYRLDVATFAPDGAVAFAVLPVNATDRVVLAEPVVEPGVVVAGPDVGSIPLSTFDGSGSGSVLPSMSSFDVAAPLEPVAPSQARPATAPPARVPAPNLVPVGASLPEEADPLVVAITLLVTAGGSYLWFGARHAAKAAVASTP